MGNPLHYGIELPQRCLTLIEELWGTASQIHGGVRPDLGPLTTTFLVSMSMPIINLPVERIERQIGLGGFEGYVDDRHVSAQAVDAFRGVIHRGNLEHAPFYQHGAWRFAEYQGEPINLARGLPEDIASALDEHNAAEDAAAMNANQWMSILRNALAHGGIVYLDEFGRSSYGKPVKMLAFASGKFASGSCPHAENEDCRGSRGDLTALRILRISEDGYRDFLREWVAWLGHTGIARAAA
ncbi:hypothetical protein [Sinorhizobium meliloti]|uniref:hypothetical protein n=1 Tax=Rhizobium meliloti TaxID=382 RepID=UPI000FD97E3C|nr:hypothetical protein [Sinorhizobium meliloti]RVP95051.1 hypothetical protein CN070_28925 [Sinorhizobium meliloti]